MNELIIALLGSGVLAQLVGTLATLRQNRRQLNASALGGEVAALEKTISLLSDNYDRQAATHRTETEELRKELTALRSRVNELTAELDRLRSENCRLRNLRVFSPNSSAAPCD